MMVNTEGRVTNLFRWQRDNVLRFTGASTVATVVWLVFDMPTFATLPLAVAGGAIGIFVSFRTNSAYDRWWEGRKLWGRLVNTSRHLSTQAMTLLGEVDGIDAEREGKAMVHRQVAYVHTLRCVLRQQDPFADADVRTWLPDEVRAELAGQSNVNHALLHAHEEQFARLYRAGAIDGHVLERLDESVMHLLDIQGGCERIKKTPLPRGYGFIAETLIRYYALLLPMALAHDLHLFAIPVTVLVCMSFSLISEAGRVLEDPFDLFWNALPLFALSKTIEHNLRERTGERDLPPLPKPDANGVLM